VEASVRQPSKTKALYAKKGLTKEAHRETYNSMSLSRRSSWEQRPNHYNPFVYNERRPNYRLP